ncbi:MAG: hypothetical protein WC489_04040 [Patescibacteria group bacterium]
MLQKHWVLFASLLLLLLLLAKNPFSQRTLIPNLEPYPDTVYYINPAKSFIEGHGLTLYRQGERLQTNVPPLYSLVLSPVFLLRNDARMFYFGNILLSLGSSVFFYLVIKKLTTNYLLLTTTLFLYVTNYFIYWYPTLAMAENLTLFLFMSSLYLLIKPVSIKNIIIASFLSVAFYATKYASLPLMAGLFLSYMIKTLRYKKLLLTLFNTSILFFLIYSVGEYVAKGSTLLVTVISTIEAVVFKSGKSNPTVINTGAWFSLSYIKVNLPVYMRAMFGGYQVRFLWDNTPILPFYIGTPGVIGLIFGVFNKKSRLLSISLIIFLVSTLLFMSAFYSQDMRYLYHAIPTLLIGFVLFWIFLHSVMLYFFQYFKKTRILKRMMLKSVHKYVQDEKNNIFIYVVPSVLMICIIFYFFTNALRLKSQIMLNLKYVESPWYYLSVKQANNVFSKTQKSKPYLITAMIPHYVDFFSNDNYILLPMSKSQDFFRGGPDSIWGKDTYENLFALYKSKLDSGNNVYLLNYLGSDENVRRDFEVIKKEFDLKLTKDGCYGSCTIWKLEKR